MFLKSLEKVVSFVSILAIILGQSLAPAIAFAQEATPSGSLTRATEPSPSPEPSPTPPPSPSNQPNSTPTPPPQPSASPEATPTSSPIPQTGSTPQVDSDWQEIKDQNTTTKDNVRLDHQYVAPQNDKVTVKFNKLPDHPGKLTIKEITLTDEQVKQTGALSNKAYDISSDMPNGTFEYTLTLPTSTTENVEVKASEDRQTFVTLGGVSPGDGILTVTGLNHFTVFVVVGTISGSTATVFEDSANPDILINEFMFNPSSGNDWVELHNKSQGDLGVNVDLTGWTLVDNTSTMITLSGTLPPGGFLAFDVSDRLNAASPNGDKIELRNAQGEIVDQVSYKGSININGAQNVGNVNAGQSVGRMVDSSGVSTNWDVFSTPTKGSANPSIIYVNGGYQDPMDTYLGTSNRPFRTIQEGIDAVAAGGTVNVLAGNYSENITIDQRSLTLNGAGVGQSTISNDPCDAELIAINTNNVTIQNFTLDDGGECGESVVTLNSQGDDISEIIIRNNEIINGSRGIETSGTVSSLQILNNSIHDNESFGIQVASGTNVTIQNNKIFNNVTGVQNQGSSSIDARENFWGHSSGPKHLTLNPLGQGNNVSNNVLFKPWYLTDALTNLDSTAPIITFSMPLPNMTLPSSITVIASTSEAATCTYSLDGGANSSMGTTGDTSHTKDLSGLTAGTHNIKLSCTDLSGNSSTSSTVSWTVIDFNNIQSNVIFDSTTIGQADLPNGITTLNLTNTTIFDVSAGLNSALGNNITIGGVVMNLSNFTSGDLVGKNLSGIQSIGGVSFEIQKAVALQSGTNGQPILLKNSDLSGVNVFLPDGVSVLAPDGWGGTIQPPKTGSSLGTAPSGFSIGSTVIEVGSGLQVLLFDKPVEVILTGVTGAVGYKSAGSTTWTQITNTCGGTYASPTNPTFPGECSISNGTDTKILTYHFTTFAALNGVSSSSTTSNTSSSGAGLSPASPPSCGDTKPGSTPTIISAVAGNNSVTLTWSKALSPVTYYLATYGLSKGAQQYGNPNVGDKDTTSYTISGLSGGTTYYFKVRAGNGCMPGDFSNELSATPTGGIVSGPAAGFAPGVLGASSEQTKPSGQVQGESTTSATQPSTTPLAKMAGFPVNLKTILVAVIILILGFGALKLFIK